MSQYPSYASYYLREFAGVSSATFKVPASTTGPLGPNQQISFNLPSNTLVSMKDVRLIFGAKASGPTNARLPAPRDLIERIQVNMGGIQVDSGCSHQNLLSRALDNMKPVEADPISQKPGVTIDFDARAGADLTGAEEYHGDSQFSLPLGPFFEGVQPNMVDMSLLPEVQVIIYLASNVVCPSPTGVSIGSTGNFLTPDTTTGTITYEVSKYHLLVPCYDIADGMYSQVIQSRMSSEGFLELMWAGYDSFTDTFTGTTRVASAASSLDKLICCFRESTWSSVAAPVPVKGYNNQHLFVSNPTAAAVLSDAADVTAGSNTFVNVPATATGQLMGITISADAGAALDGVDQALLGQSKYLPKAFNMPAPYTYHSTNNPKEPELSISVNSVRYPQFNAPLSLWYELSKDAFQVDRTLSKTYAEWAANRCQLAVRFNLPQSAALRAKSGLDLRGSNASIILEQSGGGTIDTDKKVVIFAESSRVLRVGVGKQLQVIL